MNKELIINNNYNIVCRLIIYKTLIIAEEGNHRPYLYNAEFFTEDDQFYKNSENIRVVPESPYHIVIDAICTLYFKYYKNCVKGCPKINKNGLLDIDIKGTCIHLIESRNEFISKKDDYYIIGASRFGDVKYLKYNSSNYNSDFIHLLT